MVREVITLQVGGFANFVGAHFWNIQDEALGQAHSGEDSRCPSYTDQNILFHQSLEKQQNNPRLVSLDLCGSLGGVSFEGDGRNAPGYTPPVTSWSGHTVVHRADRIDRSEFVQQLDWEEDAPYDDHHIEPGSHPHPIEAAAEKLQQPTAVRFWTDFSKVQLHPKSIYQAPGLWQGTATSEGFFGLGSVLQGQQSRDEVADRIRFFAEGCDTLQGFNVMADDLGGWGHVTAELLGELRDDYPSSPVLLWATRRPQKADGAQYAAQLQQRHFSEALSYATLAPLVSSFCCVDPLLPKGPGAYLLRPHCLDTDFGAGAAIAAALDCATLPWRLTQPLALGALGGATGAMSMGSMIQSLQGGVPSTLTALMVALPPPPLPADPHTAAASADARQQLRQAAGVHRRHQQHQASESRQASSNAIFTDGAASWTPGIRGLASETEAELVVLRGCRTGGATAATSDEAAAALDASLAAEGARCVQRRCVVPSPMPIPLPFPHLFTTAVGRYGDIMGGSAAIGRSTVPRSMGSNPLDAVVSAPVMTRLASSRGFRDLLSCQHHHLHYAIHAGAGHAALSAGELTRNDIREAMEHLHDLGSVFDDSASPE